MARGLVLSIVKKSCKKIVAWCTIVVHTVFCKECDCNLCDSCINDHNNFKLTLNHEMLLLKSTE